MDKNNVNQLGLGKAVENLQSHFQQSLNLIKAVQEEARLELHLGEMDAKQVWANLGSQLSKAEHQALQEAPAVLDHAIKALRSVRDRLGQTDGKGPAKPAST